MARRPPDSRPKKAAGFWETLKTAIADHLPRQWKADDWAQRLTEAQAHARVDYKRLHRERCRESHKARMTAKRRARSRMEKRSRRINFGLLKG